MLLLRVLWYSIYNIVSFNVHLCPFSFLHTDLCFSVSKLRGTQLDWEVFLQTKWKGPARGLVQQSGPDKLSLVRIVVLLQVCLVFLLPLFPYPPFSVHYLSDQSQHEVMILEESQVEFVDSRLVVPRKPVLEVLRLCFRPPGWPNTAQKSTNSDWTKVPVNMAIQCLMKSGVKISC